MNFSNDSKIRKNYCCIVSQVGKRTFTAVNPNQQVAINVGVATEEDLKLNTFAHCAPAAAASENPSETFARLGMRSSKDGKAFDLDRQLQLVNNSSSLNDLSKYFFSNWQSCSFSIRVSFDEFFKV